MGGYTPKLAINKLGYAQKESCLSLRDPCNHDNQEIQCHKRLGCSTQPKYLKSSQAGISDTSRFSRASGKLMAGSSPKTNSSVHIKGKHHKDHQKTSSHKEAVSLETNITQASDSILSTARKHTVLSKTNDMKSGVLKGTGASFHKPTRIENQITCVGSPKLLPASMNSARDDWCGPTNLGEYSTNGKIMRGSSVGTSSSTNSKRAHVAKGRSNGECSTNGNIMRGSSTGRSSSTWGSPSCPPLTLSDCSLTQQASRRARKQTVSRDDVSVCAPRDGTGRSCRHSKGKITSPFKPLSLIPPLHQNDLSMSVSSTSSQLSPPTLRISTIRDNGTVHDQLTECTENAAADFFHGLSVDQDGFSSFSTDGIAEVLSALERIEQDEELHYEQRLVLESNLFFDGIGFFDQHRDMRLDIDNMSYEELLDLEEKMGTVSTALPEEALSNCLDRSFYNPTCLEARSDDSLADGDVKCSICQEEYVKGDEVGKLGCNHAYHIMCINRWLGQKNWCPICKEQVKSS